MIINFHYTFLPNAQVGKLLQVTKQLDVSSFELWYQIICKKILFLIGFFLWLVKDMKFILYCFFLSVAQLKMYCNDHSSRLFLACWVMPVKAAKQSKFVLSNL